MTRDELDDLKRLAWYIEDIKGVSFEGPAAKTGAILKLAGTAGDLIAHIETLEAQLSSAQERAEALLKSKNVWVDRATEARALAVKDLLAALPTPVDPYDPDEIVILDRARKALETASQSVARQRQADEVIANAARYQLLLDIGLRFMVSGAHCKTVEETNAAIDEQIAMRDGQPVKAVMPDRQAKALDLLEEWIQVSNSGCEVQASLCVETRKYLDGKTVPVPVRKLGIRGSAYDLPSVKRAYTYADQPDNVVAHRLGRALTEAHNKPAGDWIDKGLGLLQALDQEGFGVFEV